MEITKDLRLQKHELLEYFRNRANEILSELALQYSASDYKKKASAFNKQIIKSKDNILSILIEMLEVRGGQIARFWNVCL